MAVILVAALPTPTLAQGMDTVRAGSNLVQPGLLAPGTYVHHNYRVDGGVRTLASRTIQAVEATPETFVIRTTHATSADSSHSLTVVRRADLAMVHHQVRAPLDSTDVTVNGRYLTGWAVLPNTPMQLIGLRLDGPVFPIEGQIPWLMGLLPLGEGYHAAVPQFSEWAARETWGLLEVLAVERITVEGAAYDCWKVDTGPLGPPGYRMTRWIDQATRRVVQSALLGPAGQTEYWSWLIRE
jgi:hypothetical protein